MRVSNDANAHVQNRGPFWRSYVQLDMDLQGIPRVFPNVRAQIARICVRARRSREHLAARPGEVVLGSKQQRVIATPPWSGATQRKVAAP